MKLLTHEGRLSSLLTRCGDDLYFKDSSILGIPLAVCDDFLEGFTSNDSLERATSTTYVINHSDIAK